MSAAASRPAPLIIRVSKHKHVEPEPEGNDLFSRFQRELGERDGAMPSQQRKEAAGLLRELLGKMAAGEVDPPSPVYDWASSGVLDASPRPGAAHAPLSPGKRWLKAHLVRKLRAEADARLETARRARASAVADVRAVYERQQAKLQSEHTLELERQREALVAQFESGKEAFMKELSGRNADEIIERVRREMLYTRHTKVVDLKNAELAQARQTIGERDEALAAASAQLAEAQSKYVNGVLEKRELSQELHTLKQEAAGARIRERGLRAELDGAKARAAELDAERTAAREALRAHEAEQDSKLQRISTLLLSTRLPNGLVSALSTLDPEALQRELTVAKARGGLRLFGSGSWRAHVPNAQSEDGRSERSFLDDGSAAGSPPALTTAGRRSGGGRAGATPASHSRKSLPSASPAPHAALAPASTPSSPHAEAAVAADAAPTPDATPPDTARHASSSSAEQSCAPTRQTSPQRADATPRTLAAHAAAAAAKGGASAPQVIAAAQRAAAHATRRASGSHLPTPRAPLDTVYSPARPGGSDGGAPSDDAAAADGQHSADGEGRAAEPVAPARAGDDAASPAAEAGSSSGRGGGGAEAEGSASRAPHRLVSSLAPLTVPTDADTQHADLAVEVNSSMRTPRPHHAAETGAQSEPRRGTRQPSAAELDSSRAQQKRTTPRSALGSADPPRSAVVAGSGGAARALPARTSAALARYGPDPVRAAAGSVQAVGPSGFVVGAVPPQPLPPSSAAASAVPHRQPRGAAYGGDAAAALAGGLRAPGAAPGAPLDGIETFSSFRMAQRAQLHRSAAAEHAPTRPAPEGARERQQLTSWRGSSEHLMAAQHARSSSAHTPHGAAGVAFEPAAGTAVSGGGVRAVNINLVKPPPLALHKLPGAQDARRRQGPGRAQVANAHRSRLAPFK